VSFTYRDRQHGGGVRTLTLPAESFIDRFLLHVLPPHFLRIRHVGFLANRTKKSRLAQCRRLLQAAPAPAPTRTTAQRIHVLTGLDPFICPHCHTDTMRFPSMKSVLSAMHGTADKTLFIRAMRRRPARGRRAGPSG